ncbi:MAG TPA: CPBP family intramembrane glutamic endopeptidase [Candidatus Limnocylindria bacterium]|nr:CPBP family intramembrane glutamic endopeptidase [Candidatus Limnocylindria bacterium]
MTAVKPRTRLSFVPAKGTLYRTTPADSWSWIKIDVPTRLVPLTVAPILYLWLRHRPASDFGLTFSHVGRDLLLAVPLGLAAFAIAAVFHEYLSRRSHRWFVPDEPDLLAQSAYYVLLNAPIEEWFFRGIVQGSLVQWSRAPAAGLLATTAIFGAYHFLGRWGWRQVAGTTVAGLALGAIYLWQPAPPSLLLPTIVHAAFTCGFLSLGPYLIFSYRRARGRFRPHAEAATPVP